MKGAAVRMMVLSGMCFLPSCFPRLYILIEREKTWTEAQTYCRWKYTDLASVHNEQDLTELNKLVEEHYGDTWIGLHADTETWKWSLEDQSYYGEGEAEFRNWWGNEPNGNGCYRVCVVMESNGQWIDDYCDATHSFFCYNKSTSSFIFVNESKTWEEAQRYCRTYHTDLVSVRNHAENDQIRNLNQNHYTWIGLYRDSWKWSDGSAYSFRKWAPSSSLENTCVTSHFGKWINRPCDNLHFFVCYSALTPVSKQVVQVVLKTTDVSVDMEELKEEVLQKFNQRLKDHNLSEDVKLTWVEQPDGKVFHKKHTNKKEKEGCNIK